MENPFQNLDQRLCNIESLLHSLRENQNNAVPQAEKEEVLTVQEAANYLNLSVPTIYSKVHNGELPVMKRTKRLYFSNKELLEYLKAGRIKTNSELEKEAAEYIQNSNK
jgi:excisionase family DNA binding protein